MPYSRKSIPAIFCVPVFCILSFSQEKPTIVLVHGAFQDGPSTWAKVEPELKATGYKVIVVNLPGRDGDQSDPRKLTTADYKNAVLKATAAEPRPIILVGHSFGGITISNVAQAAPAKIKALVYLSAYLPKNGESLQSLSQTDKDSKSGKDAAFVVSPDYKYLSIKPESGGELFGSDAKGATKTAIAKSLIPEPLAPTGIPVTLTPDKFGSVPKFYIETTQDEVVSPTLQERMIQGAGVKRVFRINAGHASYITQSHAVAEAILTVAAK